MTQYESTCSGSSSISRACTSVEHDAAGRERWSPSVEIDGIEARGLPARVIDAHVAERVLRDRVDAVLAERSHYGALEEDVCPTSFRARGGTSIVSQCGFPVGIRFDGATWWGTFHFWLGIAALVVMTGAEVLSHVYSVRKDTLVEEKQKADESAARKKQRELRKQVKAAEQKAADAAQRADVLEKHAAQRALSKEEHDAIVAAVSPFRGQRVLFASLIGDGDGAAFKRDIAAALRDAGWVFDGGALSSESAIIPLPSGSKWV